MKLSKADAALLNARELELVQAKGPWHVKDLARLIERTRNLRDKQRDLVQRQTIASARRGDKGRLSGAANVRTAAKAGVFERALERFQAELRQLDADSTQAARALLPADGRKAAPKREAKLAKKAAAAPTSRGAAKRAGKRAAVKKTAPAGARKAATEAPERPISKKARVRVPKSAGTSPGAAPSLRSQRTRAKKSRRG